MSGSGLRGVLFDYGLTLVTYRRPSAALRRGYARIATLVSEQLGVPRPAPGALLDAVHDGVERAVHAHEQQGRLEEIDLVPVHRGAYSALGLELGPALLDAVIAIEQEAWVEGMTVAGGVPEVLRTLRRLGVRIGVCSNAPYRPQSMRAQLATLGLAPFIDAAVFSSEVGWRKPSPHIFDAALAALGTPRDRTLMVGDRLAEDVAGARSAGLATVRLRQHHDDAQQGLGEADWVIDDLGELVPLATSLAIESPASI